MDVYMFVMRILTIIVLATIAISFAFIFFLIFKRKMDRHSNSKANLNDIKNIKLREKVKNIRDDLKKDKIFQDEFSKIADKYERKKYLESYIKEKYSSTDIVNDLAFITILYILMNDDINDNISNEKSSK